MVQQEQEMILIYDLLTVNLGNEERKRCSALGPETEVPLQKRGRDGTMLRSLLGLVVLVIDDEAVGQL